MKRNDTTVRLGVELYRRVKERAARDRRTLQATVQWAVTVGLGVPEPQAGQIVEARRSDARPLAGSVHPVPKSRSLGTKG